MSHLQYEWVPSMATLIFTSKDNTLIRYDDAAATCRLNASDLSFAAMVCDLERCCRKQSERVPAAGSPQSCAVSVAYAVRHPERVSHLVLYGGYAKVGESGDRHAIDTHEAMTTLIRSGEKQSGVSAIVHRNLHPRREPRANGLV
jgi:hypothetical protein